MPANGAICFRSGAAQNLLHPELVSSAFQFRQLIGRLAIIQFSGFCFLNPISRCAISVPGFAWWHAQIVRQVELFAAQDPRLVVDSAKRGIGLRDFFANLAGRFLLLIQLRRDFFQLSFDLFGRDIKLLNLPSSAAVGQLWIPGSLLRSFRVFQ